MSNRDNVAFREVAERYIKQPSKRLGRPKSPAAKKAIEDAINRYGDRPIDSFGVCDVTDYVEDLQELGFKSATINSRLRYFIAVLNYAKNKRGLIEAQHVPAFENLNTSEDAREPRVLGEKEVHRLLFTLPKLQSSMARFALATGLRVSNVRDLMWSEVQDGMINIKASKMKAGKQLFVPMSEEAMKILQEQRDIQSKRGQTPEYVFTKRNGKPMGSRTSVTNGVWQRACERAEIGSVRFHDLRHTWATRHVLSGTPLPLLQKLGGWNSMAMLEKYTHLSSMDMKNFVNNGMSVPRNTYIQNERSDDGIEQDVLKEAQATSVAQKRASKMVVELGGIEPPTSTLPVLGSESSATHAA